MNFMKNRNLISLLCIAGLGVTADTMACAYHGDSMAGFAAYHPMMQRHMADTQMEYISLKVDQIISTKTAKETNSKLSLFVPTSYYDVSVSLAGSEHVELLSEQSFDVTGLIKKNTMVFRTLENGEHLITVKVKAKRGSVPVEIEKTVKIQSV